MDLGRSASVMALDPGTQPRGLPSAFPQRLDDICRQCDALARCKQRLKPACERRWRWLTKRRDMIDAVKLESEDGQIGGGRAVEQLLELLVDLARGLLARKAGGALVALLVRFGRWAVFG
jgi:hypothetical protein